MSRDEPSQPFYLIVTDHDRRCAAQETHAFLIALESAVTVVIDNVKVARSIAPSGGRDDYFMVAYQAQAARAEVDIPVQQMSPLAEPGQRRRDHRMTGGTKIGRDVRPAPAAEPRTSRNMDMIGLR